MSITKKQREKLFTKYKGKCAYCGCELPKSWHADHLEPIKREFEFVKNNSHSITKCTRIIGNKHLDTFDNLNPSCPECNLHKGSGTLEQFRNQLSDKINQLRSYSKNFRFAEKFKQVTVNDCPIVFYFEIFNNEK